MSVKQKIKSFSLFVALGLNLLLLVVLGFDAHTRAGDAEPSETPKLCLAALTIKQPQPAPQVVQEQIKKPESKPKKVVKKKPVPPKKITKVVNPKPKPVKKVVLPPKPVMTQVDEPIIEVDEEFVEIREIAPPPLPDPRVLAEQAAKTQQAQERKEAIVAELIKRFNQEKRFPALAKRMGLSGTVTLLISVDPSGHISHFEIWQGNASHNVLRKSAIKTARRVAKKPLSMAGPDKSLRVKVPIVYELI